MSKSTTQKESVCVVYGVRDVCFVPGVSGLQSRVATKFRPYLPLRPVDDCIFGGKIQRGTDKLASFLGLPRSVCSSICVRFREEQKKRGKPGNVEYTRNKGRV